MEEEIWKDIKGYEGLYQVSNLGRIRSLDRIIYVNDELRPIRKIKGKILKLRPNKQGYLRTIISKNCKIKSITVHRIVAETFISNSNNLPCVNHIDEDVTNNTVKNLEWCTYDYNNNYGTRSLRESETKLKMNFHHTEETKRKIGYASKLRWIKWREEHNKCQGQV